MEVWELCPQRGPEAEPLVRGVGDEARPPEAETLWTFNGYHEFAIFF